MESYSRILAFRESTIQRARASVLTYRRIGTCRESDRGQRGIWKESSGLRTTVRRFQFKAKRADRKAGQYGATVVEGNEGTCDETDDDKSIDLTITDNPVEEKVDSGHVW
jgi:hypothetical protein